MLSSLSTPTGWPAEYSGMGDMLSLIEKAQESYDDQQAAKLEKKLTQKRVHT